MGINNSSDVCVRPVMRKVLQDDTYLHNIIQTLTGGSTLIPDDTFSDISSDEIWFEDAENKRYEKHLRPLESHLLGLLKAAHEDKEVSKLISNKIKVVSNTTSTDLNQMTTGEFRSLLICGNCDVIRAAEAHIKDWYLSHEGGNYNKLSIRKEILEGNTCPDAFIENDKAILIVEGKFTEPQLTRHTSYLPHRDQMLRHIEGAIEYNRSRFNGEKSIFAFFIVDQSFAENVMPGYNISESISRETINKYDRKLIETVTACYCGYTSWQKIGLYPQRR